MSYALELMPSAIDDLRKLDRGVRLRVRARLEWFAEHGDQVRPNALTGQWAGYARFRIGAYRAIVRIDEDRNALTVFYVRHRSEAYRD